MTSGLALEDAVPPSDLHLDEDFDKLEDRDKTRKGADTFLKQIKKWSSRHFLSQYTKLLFSELPTRPDTEPEHSWRRRKKSRHKDTFVLAICQTLILWTPNKRNWRIWDESRKGVFLKQIKKWSSGIKDFFLVKFSTRSFSLNDWSPDKRLSLLKPPIKDWVVNSCIYRFIWTMNLCDQHG